MGANPQRRTGCVSCRVMSPPGSSRSRFAASAGGLLAFLVLLQLDDDGLRAEGDFLLDHADVLGEVGLELDLHAVGVEIIALGVEGLVLLVADFQLLVLAILKVPESFS